jgi:DMSO/TMAO reductase YedYZ molybdopterin-dependent catalytic subunit
VSHVSSTTVTGTCDAPAPLDVVRADPLCAETPPGVLQHALTPAESVYVRSNFATPRLGESHRLRIGGAVMHPFDIGLAELAAMPQHTVTVTMECAGNGRLGMDPVPSGEPWKYGAVSTTSWSGVPLRALLERAGVHGHAIEVLASGADAGPRDDAQGSVRFERSVPVDTALHPDTIVATHMDGAPLTYDHGAPLRFVVPGWYGMANVKWLTAFEVLTEPFTGYFQRKRYVYITEERTEPVARALVKSLIVAPQDGGRCRRDAVIRGWAWSGNGAITEVSVAVNDRWHSATLGVPASPYAWTPFECAVALPPGEVALRSRAGDASGARQPDRIIWNRLGYGNNAVHVSTVHVD